MSKTVVLCGTFAFSVIMVAFVFLAYKHIDTTPLVTFAIGLTTGIVPGIGSFLKSHEAQKGIQSVADDVTTVKAQTNGPLTAAIAQIEQLTADMASLKEHTNGQGVPPQ